MATLEENLRHADRNEQMRASAAETLAPAMRVWLAGFFEIDETDLGAVRDAVKDVIAARKRREERKNQTIFEIIKWSVGAALGALLGWLFSHQSVGGR